MGIKPSKVFTYNIYGDSSKGPIGFQNHYDNSISSSVVKNSSVWHFRQEEKYFTKNDILVACQTTISSCQVKNSYFVWQIVWWEEKTKLPENALFTHAFNPSSLEFQHVAILNNVDVSHKDGRNCTFEALSWASGPQTRPQRQIQLTKIGRRQMKGWWHLLYN